MTNEALQEKLLQLQPALVIEMGNEWLQATVEPAQWRELALQLRNDATLQFDYLFCLTCVDWKTHLGMVYHFTSTSLQHTLVVKSTVDRENPEIETVSDIWRTAEFHEREVYDLFGVKFLHHPDLRRLLLTDDFNGFPLRKDFEDPINLIKL